ncbi:MAG: DUF4260 domain-containing protein [Armatimonadota bacterium]|nr:DUF4260 domain-containing protein [Armatimonadota bacterium]
MRLLIKIEELCVFGLSLFLFAQLDYAWWWYVVLFLAPDAGMLGYLANPVVGAITYNVVHHRATAVGAYVVGALTGTPALQLAGVVLLGHSGLDRVLGYGLKHTDSFQYTHLGDIARPRQA